MPGTHPVATLPPAHGLSSTSSAWCRGRPRVGGSAVRRGRRCADRRASTYGGIKPDDYAAWFLPIADELRPVLKPTGTFILNIKEPAIKGERHTCVIELVLGMRKQGWLWTEEFRWHKTNCYPGK